MIQTEAKKRVAQLVYIGAPVTSILIVTGFVSDPVNLTKQTGLGVFALAIASVLLFGKLLSFKSAQKYLLALSSIFVLFSFNSVAFSSSGFTQGLYGVYGRSTGLLTYIALVIFMIGSAQLDKVIWHRKLIIGFILTGVTNVIYCAWVLAFGDFIGWNNPYGEILGLFGNPNFIGAFLGMFVVGASALLLDRDLSPRWKALGVPVILLAFFEILKSRAIQGVVVSAGGLALLLLVWLWGKRTNIYVFISSLLVISGMGVLSVLGALQKGPFTFVYKKSVSLRGTYWKSGMEMGTSHPLTGVGMDSYGDWYRRARPPVALIDTPGIGVVTNAAHNVIIDIFAYGGFPLFLSYLGILFLGIKAILGILKRRNPYDPIFAFLAIVWICYLVQSVISINQIGLAIWGWVFTGALISYAKITEIDSENGDATNSFGKQLRTKKSTKSKNSSATVSLATGIGLLAGLMIYLPPLSGDIKWFSARNSRNLEKIETALQPSYFNPANSSKYLEAISLLQSNNLGNLALKYIKASIAFNPDSFDSWYALYVLQESSQEEKGLALLNLKRLDPLNPDVTVRK
jgi:O-antigen ligase